MGAAFVTTNYVYTPEQTFCNTTGIDTKGSAPAEISEKCPASGRCEVGKYNKDVKYNWIEWQQMEFQQENVF